MTLPSHHPLDMVELTAFTPSCATAPAAAYVRVPLRCRLLTVTGVLGGPISSADGLVTVSLRSRVLASFAVPQEGSAAGQLFSAVPAAPVHLDEDDVLVLTPSGASGVSVPMHLSVTLRAA